MLLDATLDPADESRPMRGPVAAYPYSFFHPEEFVEAGFSPERLNDRAILSALLGALGDVYEARATRRVVVPTASRDPAREDSSSTRAPATVAASAGTRRGSSARRGGRRERRRVRRATAESRHVLGRGGRDR